MIQNNAAREGYQYYQENKFTQAAIYFQKWIDEEPEVFQAYISKGIALHKNHQFEEALLEDSKAQEKAPGNQYVIEFRAEAKRKMGKDTEVIEELRKLITSNKKCSTIFYCLGRSYYNLRQYSKAKQNYLKAIQQNGKYYRAYMELGKMSREQWNQRESIDYLSKAIQFSKDMDESVYIERAMTYQQRQAVKAVELSFLVENIERLKQLVTERVLAIIQNDSKGDVQDRIDKQIKLIVARLNEFLDGERQAIGADLAVSQDTIENAKQKESTSFKRKSKKAR